MKCKLFLLLAAATSLLCGCSTNSASLPISSNSIIKTQEVQRTSEKPRVVSLGDLGTPITNAGSYYSDNVLYYASSASTVGYQLEDNNVLIHMYLAFNEPFVFPMWGSFNFRASSYDRTCSPAQTQQGYSFLLFYSGAIEVYKNGALLTSALLGPYGTTKHEVYMGAVEEDKNIRLTLKIDDLLAIDYLDQVSPLVSGGNWFNLCGDAGVSYNCYNTSKTFGNDYQSYTLSDFRDYPYSAGNPEPLINSKEGTAKIFNGSNTIGYKEYLGNFTLEYQMYFDSLPSPANIWFTVRTNTFTRANQASDGYSFRFSTLGNCEIWKLGNGGGVLSGGYFTFQPKTWYTIVLGCVTTSKGSVMLSTTINGKTYSSCEDTSNPYLNGKFILITPDGEMYPELRSCSTTTRIFNFKESDNENTKDLSLYFLNSVSSKDVDYTRITQRNLNSILLDGLTVPEINSKYYALDENSLKTRAVDVKFVDNVLKITINKKCFNSIDNSPIAFSPNEIEVLRTSGNSGLLSDSNKILIFSYHQYI